jgi:hypothetical protein
MYLIVYGVKGGHISEDMSTDSRTEEYITTDGAKAIGRRTLCGKHAKANYWSVINTQEDKKLMGLLCKECVQRLRRAPSKSNSANKKEFNKDNA